mmetsp:Transcript_13865/g.38327  ORF Transcript_13865/g.38327 Transcript_13865/m.38327 type:complete len:289 (-) Transcript_13865:1973-2839(-)
MRALCSKLVTGQCRQHCGTNNCQTHGISSQIPQFNLGFTAQCQSKVWNTLDKQLFRPQQWTAQVRDKELSPRRNTTGNARNCRTMLFFGHILRNVPKEGAKVGIVRFGVARCRNVQNVEHVQLTLGLNVQIFKPVVGWNLLLAPFPASHIGTAHLFDSQLFASDSVVFHIGIARSEKVNFLKDRSLGVTTRRPIERFSKDSNIVVIRVQNKCVQRMTHWILQVGDQCLPIIPQIIFVVVWIVRFPHKHISTIASLWESVILGVHLLDASAIGTFTRFKDNGGRRFVNP